MLDGNKMERIVINHKKRKNLLYKYKVPNGYELHHIIPHCIGGTDSPENLAFVKISDHKRISGKDRKIINKLKKMGFMESITHYSVEVKVSLNKIKKEFLKLKNEYK